MKLEPLKHIGGISYGKGVYLSQPEILEFIRKVASGSEAQMKERLLEGVAKYSVYEAKEAPGQEERKCIICGKTVTPEIRGDYTVNQCTVCRGMFCQAKCGFFCRCNNHLDDD